VFLCGLKIAQHEFRLQYQRRPTLALRDLRYFHPHCCRSLPIENRLADYRRVEEMANGDGLSDMERLVLDNVAAQLRPHAEASGSGG